MNFYRIGSLSLILAWLLSYAQAQEQEQRRKVAHELLKLRDYSIAYDDYSKMFNKNEKYRRKRDSVELLYRGQIRKIKYGPLREEVLVFLNNATKRDSALYNHAAMYNYKSYDQLLTVNPREIPTLLEYYKAVMYSLFEQDKDELLHMRDIPFLKYKQKLSIEEW